MSYRRWQLSPQDSTRGIKTRIPIKGSWSNQPGNLADTEFLQSWLEYHSNMGAVSHGGINWGAVSGLALAIAVSAGFWAVVGFAIARIWG